MKVTGIIAEYNPFHLGHQYQLHTLRKQEKPDYVIAAMSGDFLQRGVPALLDKYARAHMALLQGVDLVLELPAWFATASAEGFARGGILLFHTTGITDSLCFGTETEDFQRLQDLARLLAWEPGWYQEALLSYLKEGCSFPTARAKSLPKYADLLESPNNILALEYLKAIALSAPAMTPYMIPRKGSGYHCEDIQAPLASASSIRAFLKKGQPDASDSELKGALPKSSLIILEAYRKNAAFLWEDDFSLPLHYALLKETRDSLLKYQDWNPSLCNRLMDKRNAFLSWSGLCRECNTKESTYARISRCLTHMLLNIQKEPLAAFHAKGSHPILPYLRVLGFRKAASVLLGALQQHAKAPVLTTPAQAPGLLSQTGMDMLAADIFASDLYRSVLTEKTKKKYPNEYSRRMLVC